MSQTQPCDPGKYRDPYTGRCHPCSDCEPSRSPNEFCLKTCLTEKCPDRYYYDNNLKKCFPCSDCEHPRTGNGICMSTCQNIPASTSATTVHPQPNNNVIISLAAVFSSLLAVVLVFIVIFLIYKHFVKNMRHRSKLPLSGTEQDLLPNGGNTPPENGPNSITANGRAVTSPTSSGSMPTFELQSVTVTNMTSAAAMLSMPRNSSATYLYRHDADNPRVSTPLLNEHPTSAITSDGSRSFQTSMIHSMPVTNPAGGQGQSSTRSTPSRRHVSFSQQPHVLSSNGSSSLEGSGLHSDDEGPIVTHPCENSGTCQFLPSKLSMPFSLS